MGNNNTFRPTRPGERGNALVLSMLILLSLTAVGVVSVQQTNTDLLVSGNLVRAAQAQMIGEGGLQHGMGFVAANPNDFMTRLEAQRGGGVDSLGQWGAVPASSELGAIILSRTTAFDSDNAPVTEKQFSIVAPGGDCTIAKVRMRQEFAYQTRGIWIAEVRGLGGTEVGSDICHQVFDYIAKGTIPNAIQTVDLTLDQADTVVVESRARALAGPSKCTKR